MSRARDLADSADKDIVGTLTVDALTVDGDVGIGTNSPSNFSGYTTLDVVNATNGGAILARGSTVEARFVADDPTGTVQVKAQSNHPLMFATSGTERMRIDSSGNIGIGTSSTAANLHVYENTSNGTINNLALLDAGNQNPSVSGSGVSLDFRTNSGTSYFGGVGGYSDGTNYVAGLWGGAAASGAPDLAVTSSGNVGIGTSSPSQLLHVNSTGNVAAVQIQGASHTAKISTDGAGTIFGTTTNGYMLLTTNSAERMRIDSSGNVGIGTSSPSGAKLDIFTGSTSADGLKINRFGSGVYYSTLRQDSHGLAIRVGDGSTIAERVAVTPNGLTFNGDTAAANALDDYEEGTWTPTAGGTATISSSVGRYTKIGRLVTIEFEATYNSSGTAHLGGLPYAAASDCRDIGVAREDNSTGYIWQIVASPSGTNIGLYNYTNSSNVVSGYGVRGTLTYYTS